MKLTPTQILRSEINELKILLSEVPEANVIDRLDLTQRLAIAEQKLNAVKPKKTERLN